MLIIKTEKRGRRAWHYLKKNHFLSISLNVAKYWISQVDFFLEYGMPKKWNIHFWYLKSGIFSFCGIFFFFVEFFYNFFFLIFLWTFYLFLVSVISVLKKNEKSLIKRPKKNYRILKITYFKGHKRNSKYTHTATPKW